MRILVVEDDPDVRQFLVASLESESYAVDVAVDGEVGSYLARTNDYDIAILDLILPKKDGNLICREVRAAGRTFPILMLSVNNVAREKANLLNHGADDYLTKPFSYVELIARIRALMRRPHKVETNILKVDDLEMDTLKQHIQRGKRTIYLTRKEFSLLEYLLHHSGNVVSRGMIKEHVWNGDGDPFSNTIEAHVLNIRKKIDMPNRPKLIHTVPGRGYKIDVKA
jgi:two-component system copper resistance phosphate regulon response regulator CusR